MTRPAAPGPRMAAGKLRVDAARAIAKLREFQLVERAAWVLEGIRAAVASSATEIVLAGDANDIWLTWRGEPWPIEDLTRLFDVLVSPEAASETQHLRLLASAVNSGLGLQPAYIDVIAIEGPTAARARYTPDVLVETGGDLADSPLRNLTADAIPVPEGAPRGMRVHLRRRASLQVLAYLFGEPPELGIARAACADIPVPLTVGANRYHRGDDARDVIRVPLGDGLDGFLAISVPETTQAAVTEVAECGVILTRYPLELGAVPLAALPIRMLIDAPRMPTNASRSQVQRGSYPIAAAERRVSDVVPKLVAELIAQLGVEPVAPRVHDAALALLAAMVERSDWRTLRDAVSPPLRELAHLPLLRDATGARRPLVARWRGLVHRGRDPVDGDLEPWVNDILWVPPGDPAERLIAGTFEDPSELRRRLRWARRERRAHRRFFARGMRPPTVIANRLPLLRTRLGADVPGSCVPQPVFAGLEGEVCIYGDEGPSELVVLHHGREIERIDLASPICFAAVIEAPLIKPEECYRGAVRDADFAHVDRAMRAGVLRAIEAIASGATGSGFVPGAPIAPGRFVRLVQSSLLLARSLGATLAPPLATAPAWLTVDGEYVGHAAVAAVAAIGVVEPRVDVQPLAGRLLLRLDRAERALLATLAPELPQIPYSARTARQPPAEAFASQLVLSHPFALAVTEESRRGAIAPLGPTETSMVTFHHRGIPLATRPYAHQLLPCRILVDSETIVPSAEWHSVLDEGGVAGDLLRWELSLARAAASALTSARPLELFGLREVDLHGSLGLALWSALARLDPTELLGSELLAHLCAQRMWSVLGDPIPTSIDLLRKRYPAMIPCVARGAVPVEGFSPLVADDLVAGAVATLAGLPVQEASLELESHRHAAARAQNLATHRERPAQPLALPSPGEAVPIDGPIVRGIVGVAPIAMEIQIFIEGRPFHAVRRDDGLPLCAAVEIDAARTMPAFDGVPDDVISEVIARVTAAAPALLVAIAAARPHVLGDPGPARTLFARWARTGDLRGTAVATLCGAPMFLTVQGPRTSVLAIGARRLPMTTWTGAWLAQDTDPPHACDAPIIQISTTSDEIQTVLRCLHGRELEDVTEAVAKLQAARRMARGLMPKPTLHGIGPECKRSLGELGSDLGAGEIALVGDETSSALLHVSGELRTVVPLDVLPSIKIAFEAPFDAPIPNVQALAIELARKILHEVPHDTIDPLIRRNLVRAMFGGMLTPAELAGVPLFETTAASWIDIVAVDGQVSLFGNVWSVPVADPVPRALDDRRIVLRLDPITVACAVARDVQIIDATDELALDAIARRNRDQPLATTLSLPTTGELLAQVALPGDGVTEPRGVVGVLHPASAHVRRIYAHRGMHPFAPRPDDLPWPVVATIDDARLTPDRTWENPVNDAAWLLCVDAIRTVTARAFLDLVKPPVSALATQTLLGSGTGLRGGMRGALWIQGPPLVSLPIHVVSVSGAADWELPLAESGMTGVVYVDGANDAALRKTLVELCEETHGILVRTMLRRPKREPALMTAHAAHALSLGRITVADAGSISFDCFCPAPLSAAELVVLFASTDRVTVVQPGDDTPGIVDDGSPLSRVVIARVRSRIRQPRTAPTAAAIRRSPEPRHPSQHLVDAICQRLAQLGLDPHDATIVDGDAPMVFDDGCLQISGTHPGLRHVADALAAGRPGATDALDAIVAHGVTVLNVALAQITDAAEARALRALLRAT